MKNNGPLVSVIIVTWNSERFIEGCLHSVLKQSHEVIEVIVIDNRSADATVNMVKEKFPTVRIIENEENLGYCRANNLSLKEAAGEYLFFINSDVILERDYVEKALQGFQKGERIGMVSGKILRFDRTTVDSTGQFLARSRKTIERGYGQKDEGRFEREGFVFSVCGAAAFYSKQMIDEISYKNKELFDEDFFSFHEDIDVGWRANLMGWRGYYTPEALAYHFRGGTGSHSGEKRSFQIAGRCRYLKYHIVKNRYLSMIKNDTLSSYLFNFPFIAARDAALFLYLLGTSPGVFRLLFKNRHLFRKAFRKKTFRLIAEKAL
jgi:GT2 family glycosyltransferase